jgi:UDP-galactopyranose mutase
MPPSDLVCFSHLPWDFVTQRPNHLMTLAARDRRVVFVEEPFDAPEPVSTSRAVGPNLRVARLGIPFELDRETRFALLAELLATLLDECGIDRPWRWYLTPMAFPWSDGLPASAVVYDCMDELSAFLGAASARLAELETELLARADVVFAGGRRLWEAKRHRHPNADPFPSAVDAEHFARAREAGPEPADQARLARPRIGFFGVIDERIDLALLDGLAGSRPDWQLVLVGPVAKIAATVLPRRPNLHWLGPKPYAELPDHLRGWDVAILPFAHNAATEFISPTKTPEYLAGGRSVVSTSIHDVVHPWADLGLVRIADHVEGFVRAIEEALGEPVAARRARLAAVDEALAGRSWEATWAGMERLVEEALASRAVAAPTALGVEHVVERIASVDSPDGEEAA